MNSLTALLLLDVAMDKGISIDTWDQDKPHFGGGFSHRYETQACDVVDTNSQELCCTYCYKPIDYKKGDL